MASGEAAVPIRTISGMTQTSAASASSQIRSDRDRESTLGQAPTEGEMEGDSVSEITRQTSEMLRWQSSQQRMSASRITYRNDGFHQRVSKAEGMTQPIFADAEAMKEKLRQNMCQPTYDVTNYYKEFGLFQEIARSRLFENITLGVIALNAIYISFDTDFNKANVVLEAMPIFQFVEHFFCLYFSCEWFIRFMSFKRKRDGLRDSWFLFDSSMVAMMVAETWVLTLVLITTGISAGSSLGNASMMRLLRLLRLSRMARMARLLRAMPELLILIKGMVSAMRSVFFTLLLQVIILYIFGITFRQLTDSFPCQQVYFTDVGTSMHTLLIYGTLMDNTGELIKDLASDSILFSMVFYVFLLISALTVMNMLIGVLCEVVSAVASTERESLTVAYVKGRLQEILRQGGLDLDGDGMISKVEFAQVLENAQAARILSEVGVDVFGLVELSDFIFAGEGDSEDDEKGGQLSFGDFMEIVLKLRGVNNATVKDIVDLRKFITAMRRQIDTLGRNLEDKIDLCEERLRRNYGRDIGPTIRTSSPSNPSNPSKRGVRTGRQTKVDAPKDKAELGENKAMHANDIPEAKLRSEHGSIEAAAVTAAAAVAAEQRAQNAVAAAAVARELAAVTAAASRNLPDALLAEESGGPGTNVGLDMVELAAVPSLGWPSVPDKSIGSLPGAVERERDRLVLLGLDRVREELDKLRQGFSSAAARHCRCDTAHWAEDLAAANAVEEAVQPCVGGGRVDARDLWSRNALALRWPGSQAMTLNISGSHASLPPTSPNCVKSGIIAGAATPHGRSKDLPLIAPKIQPVPMSPGSEMLSRTACEL